MNNVKPPQNQREREKGTGSECSEIYRKYVLNLLKYNANLYFCRCSTDLRYNLGHSVAVDNLFIIRLQEVKSSNLFTLRLYDYFLIIDANEFLSVEEE